MAIPPSTGASGARTSTTPPIPPSPNEEAVQKELSKLKNPTDLKPDTCFTLFTFLSNFVPANHNENGVLLAHYSDIEQRIESISRAVLSAQHSTHEYDAQIKKLENELLVEKTKKAKLIIDSRKNVSKDKHYYIDLFNQFKIFMHLQNLEEVCSTTRLKLIERSLTLFTQSPEAEEIYSSVRVLLKSLKTHDKKPVKVKSITKTTKSKIAKFDEIYRALIDNFKTLKDSVALCSLTSAPENELNDLIVTVQNLKKRFTDFDQEKLHTRKELDAQFEDHFRILKALEVKSLPTFKTELEAKNILSRIKFIHLYKTSPQSRWPIEEHQTVLSQCDSRLQQMIGDLQSLLKMLQASSHIETLSGFEELKTRFFTCCPSAPRDSSNKDPLKTLEQALATNQKHVEQLNILLSSCQPLLDSLRNPQPPTLLIVNKNFESLKKLQSDVYALQQAINAQNALITLDFVQKRLLDQSQRMVAQRTCRELSSYIQDGGVLLRIRNHYQGVISWLQALPQQIEEFEKKYQNGFGIYQQLVSQYHNEQRTRADHVNNRKALLLGEISSGIISLIPDNAIYNDAKEYLNLLNVILDSLKLDNTFTETCLELLDKILKEFKSKTHNKQLTAVHIRSLINNLRIPGELVNTLKSQIQYLNQLK